MNKETQSAPSRPVWLELVKKEVEGLRFGTVEIVVHDARVVQIEKTEKVRFEKGEPSP